KRFAVVNVRPSISALCVGDEPPSDDGETRTGVYYAVRALRLLGRDAEGSVQVNQVRATDLSLENLSDYDVILMANVADVAPETVKLLDEFVRRGGGLIFFLGNQVEAESYNKRFGAGPSGLLPGELGKTLAVGEDEPGWTLGPIQSDHSLAMIVKRLPQEITDAARFSKVMQAKPAPNSRTILTITEQDAPLLLSRKVGTGTVLMFTTSADRAWNELPVHPLYAMLLRQAATNLTSRPDDRGMIVGESVELAVHGRRVGDVAQLKDPQGQIAELKITRAGDQSVCAIETETAGVYEVAQDKEAPAVTLAANVDPTESNVRVMDSAALANELEPLGVHVIADAGSLAGAIENSRQGRELGSLLLACGIFVFLLQGWLAKYFTNRMSDAETDVSAALQMSRVAAARRS
ncbi:MAG: hypothetical protein N2C14_16620, partial [Planctomycetales bacterium]